MIVAILARRRAIAIGVLLINTLLAATSVFAQPSFTAHTITTSIDYPQGDRAVYAVDLDGDGDVDVLSASRNDNKIAWYENDGSEVFTTQNISTTASGPRSVHPIDMDDDGDIDVLTGAYDGDKAIWFRNDGSENFTQIDVATGINEVASAYAVDVDSDNDIDVVLNSDNNGSGVVAWCENDGSENFTYHVIATGIRGRSVYAIDVDGDADIDVISTTGDYSIEWYENNGSEIFTAHNITTAADAGCSVFAIDLDKDGDIDVLSASWDDDKIAWYENNGAQSFTEHAITTTADVAHSVYAIDMDGDSDIDVLSASSLDDRVTWYENNGAQSFTVHDIATVDGAQSVFAIDLDGDGDVDVLSTSQGDNKINWYENNGGTTERRALSVNLPGGAAMDFVWIEPGTFLMGSPESEEGRWDYEGPQHQVTISKGFYLGKYEITQAQWESVMGRNPSEFLGADRPVETISWTDAQLFVNALNQVEGEDVFRLPTEAEWEYACRAGTTTRWSFGDEESRLGGYAWYSGNVWDVGLQNAQPVGQKLPNPWGLHDMHGNVWEWCQDWSSPYTSESQVDPTGPTIGPTSSRIARGGDFSPDARSNRSATRGNLYYAGRSNDVGARLLRMAEPVSPNSPPVDHTIRVPEDFPSIQAGIDAASNGDTVLVQPGTYRENIDFQGKSIVVESLYLTAGDPSYISSTIIDGGSAGSVVTVSNGETGAKLVGLTIQNGEELRGGGIFVNGGVFLELEHIKIHNNRSTSVSHGGGGIYCGASDLVLRNVDMIDNTAQNIGGGIYAQRSTITIEGGSIQGSVSGNTGSGIHHQFGTLAILGSKILNNSSAYNGGGIYYNGANGTFTNVLLCGNSARARGGGIFCEGTLLFTNVTIAKNTAEGDYAGAGGGVFIAGANITVNNAIVWGNTPNSFEYYDIGVSNSLSVSFSDIEGGQAGINTKQNGIVSWAAGNMVSDPYFANSDIGDYRLSDRSPAIGAGTTSGAPTTDIEGNERPAPSGTNPDMGAFENSLSAPLPVPNHPPTFSTIANQSVVEGSALSLTLSGSDPDGDGLIYSVSGNPAGSSLADNVWSWTPSGGQAGSYTFSFTVSDGKGGSDTQSVTITVTAPVLVNQPPFLVAIPATTIEENQTLSFTLFGSDSDGDALDYTISNNPAGSSLTGNTFSWTPSSGQAGSYNVTLTVSDGRGGTDSKVATITVVAPPPPNQAPTLQVIGNKAIEIDQTVSFTLAASDPDGDALSYTVSGAPSGSALSGNTFSWTPSSGQAGSYNLSLTVSDGKGGTSSQPVTITVTVPAPVNQPPALAPIEAKTIEENQTLSFVLSATDPDGDALIYEVAGNPSGSSLSGSTFSWVPSTGQAGSYAVSFTVSDGKGGAATQSATITVTQAPQEPVAQNNPPMIYMGQLFSTLGGNTLKEGVLLSFSIPASDPDGDALTFNSIGNPPGSMIIGDVFSWTPTYDQAGSYTLTFSVNDGKGGTDTESIAIRIAPGNRRPVLGVVTDQAIREGQALSFVIPGSDPDSDALTFTVLGNPAGSSLVSNNFSWTPDVGQAGSHRLVFTVDDGKGGTDSKVVTITVLKGNEPPVLAAIEDRLIPEGEILSITLSGTDPEGERLTYSVSGNPPGSTLQGNVFSWAPSSGQAGSYTLNFIVTDTQGGSQTQPVTITVAPPNREPVLADIADRSVSEGQPVSFSLSATDSDGDDLIYTVSGHPTGSTLEGNIFSWTPTEGQAGSYTLTFIVSDGRGGTDRKSGTITVERANRKPVLADIADQSVQEGQTLEFTLNATDPDGDPLTYSVSGHPAGSTLSGRAFTFTPTAAQTGASEVTFTVTDDEGATDTQSVTITVIPGNHKPELVDLVPRTIEEDQTLSFTVNANDIDGDELTYSVTGNPSGSRFMGNVFSWKPDIGQVGSYSVTFSVSDSEGGADTQTILITVTEIPKPEPSSLAITVTPVVPTEDIDIELHISAIFPSLASTITKHFFGVDGELISISLSTEQAKDGAIPDDPSAGWTVIEHIGRLEAGNYEIVVLVNGNEFSREALQVRDRSGSKGIVTIDFDPLPGNQGKIQDGEGEVGKQYDIQLHIKDIRQAFSGWSIALHFDPNAIEFIPGSFAPSEFLPGLTPLEDIKTGVVEIGGVVLQQTEGSSGDAQLATVSFRLLGGFDTSASIFITDNQLKFPDGGSERYPIFVEAVITELPPVQGDFDGDGKVDFTDFFAFADAFGGSAPEFDLNDDGRVDFTDFFTFADNFGREARAKLMVLAERHLSLPAQPELEPNFPNPFNSATEIRYSLSRSSVMELTVYDIGGARIVTLVNGFQSMGAHEVTWDGRDDEGRQVGSGVYLLKLRAQDAAVQTGKLLLIR